MATPGCNMAHMVWEREGGGGVVLLVAHTGTAPSDGEWDAWLATLEQMNKRFAGEFSLCANLVLTDGGGPSQSQRTRVNTLVAAGRSSPPVAVVTDSRVVRTLGSGLSIFNPRFRVFPPAQFTVATVHLGMARHEVGPMLRAVQDMVESHMGAGMVKTLQHILGEPPKS